jgi:hypothetical protein
MEDAIAAADTRCAIWARVSTEDQDADNQLTIQRASAPRRSPDVAELVTEDSGWQNGNDAQGKEFDRKRSELLEGAQASPLPCRAHLGAAPALAARTGRHPRHAAAPVRVRMRRAVARGELAAHQLTGTPRTARRHLRAAREAGERPRSANTKAGIARNRADGKPVGRQAGARDKAKRKRSGYVSAREGESGERRRAALAERNRQRALSTKTDEPRPFPG